MKYIVGIAVAVAMFAFAAAPAEAKSKKHRRAHVAHVTQIAPEPCYDRMPNSAGCIGGEVFGVSPAARAVGRVVGDTARRLGTGANAAIGRVTATILPHPAGCPGTQFCGCGASVRVFGHSRRDLWLARAWYKFPRGSVAAGNVAVRAHHVFVIERVYEDGTVLAYDANSGGHQTRLHRRSLAGYTVVNPRA